MRRLSKAILLAMVLSLGATTQAVAADWWGWLEEFSGPGPFRIKNPLHALHLTFHCVYEDQLRISVFRVNAITDEVLRRTEKPAAGAALLPAIPPTVPVGPVEVMTSRGSKLFGTPFPIPLDWTGDLDLLGTALTTLLPSPTPDDSPEKRQWSRARERKYCWYVDFARYRAVPDPVQEYPEIKATKVDIGFAYFIGGPIDIGAAGGWIWFRPKGGDIIGRYTFTPLRVQVRPLAFFAPSSSDRSKWLARLAYVPKLYFKQTAILRSIRASEFGAPLPNDPNLEFRTGPEVVSSYGIVFDIGELIGAFVPDKPQTPTGGP
jgi:hypothetical protein